MHRRSREEVIPRAEGGRKVFQVLCPQLLGLGPLGCEMGGFAPARGDGAMEGSHPS